MSKIYHDDEWKRADDAPPAKADFSVKKRTRAEEQARVNLAYAHGKMDRAEWLRRTDELGEVSKWSADGKIL